MGLLQALPDQGQITSALSGLIGDTASGTGIGEVLTVLETLNPSRMVADLSRGLGEVSLDAGGGSGGLTGDLLGGFERLVQDFPQDPDALLAPLTARLESLAGLLRSDLAGGLGRSVGGLQSLETLLPQDAGALLGGAARGLEALRAQFLSGPLGQLRAWSDDLARLDEGLAELAGAGAGGPEEALVGYLAAEAAEVARVVLPGGQSPADRLAALLDGAIAAERLTALSGRKQALIEALDGARQDLEGGEVTSTARLDAAAAAFRALQDDLAGVVDGLGRALDDEAATPEGMAAALRRQYEQFLAVEIVDLGSVRERLSEALEGVREALEGFSLAEARAELDGVFQGIAAAVGQFDLASLRARLGELRGQIEAAAGDLDALLLEIVASIRAAFGRIREGLQTVVSSLGEYDESGQFHFSVQQQIEEFLNGISQTISGTLEPLLTGFKETVRGALGQVRTLLAGIQAQIDSVKAQLQSALQGVADQLRELDVPGRIDALGARLEEMLGQLGAIDFDLVVNPVIAQIEEMRDTLRGIDLSALNDFLREALGVAVQVVLSIDFPGQITDALLAELDRLLQAPKDALSAIEARVEGALQEVGRLAPDELLRPLDTLFAPVSRALDQLRVEALVEPVAEWYGDVRAEVERLSPAELLRPVVEAYAGLQQTLGSLSPERLVQPLVSLVAGFRAELQRLDLSGVTGGLGGVVERVRALLAGLDPAALLAPLVQAYDTVRAALDGLDPAALLAPLGRLFERLAGPLESLSAPAAQRIGAAFAPLADLPGKFEPGQVFAAAAARLATARAGAAELNVGRLIGDLRGPFEALSTALPAGADPALAARVAGLNPLRSEALGAAAARLQQLQPRLASAFAQPQPPGDLLGEFEGLRPRLQSLIPAWAGGAVTPEALRAALADYDPSGVAEEARAVVDDLRQQLAALDPRPLQEDLRETFAALDGALAAIEPGAVSAEIEALVRLVAAKLDRLDPQLLVDELQGLADELQGLLAGIDPAAIISALEGLANDVKRLVAGLNPAELLAGLKEPFEDVRGLLDSFSPAALREALQIVFTEIQAVLEAIDLGKVLEPLVDRIDQLRDELERALRRTEAAFEEMVAAIPL